MWHTIKEINLENYICSLEQGEESSAGCSVDTEPSAQSKSRNIRDKSCSNASETESCQSFQSGMTCEHLTENHGAEKSMSFAEDSHARIFPAPEKERESTASDLECGEKWQGSSAKYDHDSHSWKTHQFSLAGGLEEFSETFPKWGIMQDGEFWGLEAAVVRWNESGFGLPAPTKSMGKRGWGISNIKARYSPELEANARLFGYKPHPSVLEWSMGWIPTWTRLVPLETDKFRKWRHSHGEF
jgi:hypothetical protein